MDLEAAEKKVATQLVPEVLDHIKSLLLNNCLLPGTWERYRWNCCPQRTSGKLLGSLNTTSSRDFWDNVDSAS